MISLLDGASFDSNAHLCPIREWYQVYHECVGVKRRCLSAESIATTEVQQMTFILIRRHQNRTDHSQTMIETTVN